MKPTQEAVEFFRKGGWHDHQLEASGYIANGEPTEAILTALRTSGWDDEKLIKHGLAVEDQTDASEPKPDKKVSRYIDLRDEVDRLKKQVKEKTKDLEEEMHQIEGELGGVLTQMGQTTMSSAYGTFFFVDKTYVKVEDYEAFQKFFLGTILNRLAAKGFIAQGKNCYDATEAAMDALGFNFLTQNVRKDAVLEYTKEHGKAPPGLSTSAEHVVQVRRK